MALANFFSKAALKINDVLVPNKWSLVKACIMLPLKSHLFLMVGF